METLENLLLAKEMGTQLVAKPITPIKKNKMIAIDLRKQQALDFDRKAIHQINFIGI